MAITPTVRRLQLGNELRRAREAAGLTQEEAADCIDASLSRMSRIELAQTKIAIGDVKLLLELYGADEIYSKEIFELARNNSSRGRWNDHRALYEDWFRMYVDLETDSDTIRATEVELVPSLLQTEQYARALHNESKLHNESNMSQAEALLSKIVEGLEERQGLLTTQTPPDVSFILSESVLHRKVSEDSNTMREQLDHLAQLASRPNVDIRILPFNAPTVRGAVVHRFTLLTVPSAGIAPPLDFVYLEDYDDARYLDNENEVRKYENLWENLQTAALSTVESLVMIQGCAKEHG